MLMNSLLNKKAWEIRKESAKKFGCKVMQVSWKHCLRMALEVVFQVKKVFRCDGIEKVKSGLKSANKAVKRTVKKSLTVQSEIKEKIHKKLNPKYRHPVYGIGEVTPLCEKSNKKLKGDDTFFLMFNGKLTEVSRFIVREV